ncbi:MAG: hypothetical protein LLF97_10280 [Planctomycetaceae bacterium]|nr:hypothetical protein [Planctomycetaceae bacterium]
MGSTLKHFCVLGVVAAAWWIPSFALADCGCGYAAPVAYSAYYAPTYVSYMPPVAFSSMPGVVYRAQYRPTAVTSYYAPVAPVYGSYAVTTYRPLLGTYRTTYRPYVAYQPVYAAPVVSYYGGCNTCVSGCTSCVSGCSPCNACSSCSATSTYVAPSSGCSSCSAPSVTTVTPSSATNTAPPQTFQQSTQKPATDTDTLKPIPKVEPQSTPAASPLLPDPSSRTASRPDYTAARVTLTSATAPTVDSDGWQSAHD